MNTHTETKHTPGPWRWHDEFILAGGDVGTRKGKCIAVSVGGFHWETEPEKEANASLIAAAPELLEACKAAGAAFDLYAMSHRQKGTPEGDRKANENERLASVCYAAIAKATGGQP